MAQIRNHIWQYPQHRLPGSLQTAVSLHSHTSRSRESMDFIPRHVAGVPLLGARIARLEAQFLSHYGYPFDYSCVWWTPPLEPKSAWELESGQIRQLGLRPLVSISDHDSVDAGFALKMIEECHDAPISSEWTVPIAPSFVHLGIHNLNPARARMLERAMAAVTAHPNPRHIHQLLDELARDPSVLIVLNHPLWDEAHMGRDVHRDMIDRFLRRYGSMLHALELNGLRPSRENLEVVALAERWGLPVVSGGDRHGCEPNAILNLTGAASFSEFVAEVRGGAPTYALYMPQYQQPIGLRHTQVVSDVLRNYDEFDTSRRRWSDRIFYREEDGTVRRLSEVWTGNGPDVVGQFVTAMRLFEWRPLRAVLRMAVSL